MLDGLNCAGTENKIIDCPRPYPVGTTSCGYNEIAGIVCPSKLKLNCKYFKLEIVALATPTYLKHFTLFWW